MLAHEPAQSATEREARDACVGDSAAGRGEAMDLRRGVKLPPKHAALGPPGAIGRINADRLHRRQIDDHAAIVGPVSRCAVSATAHGEQKAIRPGEIHRLAHIAGIRATNDQRRTPVNVTIPNPARGFVFAIAGQNDPALQATSQCGEAGLLKMNAVSAHGQNVGHTTPHLLPFKTVSQHARRPARLSIPKRSGSEARIYRDIGSK